MGLESSDLVSQFLFYAFEEPLRRWISRAGEHHIVEQQKAFLVTELVEFFPLIPSAAPDTEHIHVGVHCVLEYFVISFPCHSGRNGIKRNPVGALGENIPAVDGDGEFFSSHGRLVLYLQSPEAYVSLF